MSTTTLLSSLWWVSGCKSGGGPLDAPDRLFENLAHHVVLQVSERMLREFGPLFVEGTVEKHHVVVGLKRRSDDECFTRRTAPAYAPRHGLPAYLRIFRKVWV